jgi:hypothetical protein
MRKFKLHTKDYSNSLSLDTNYLVAEVKGLGFSLEYEIDTLKQTNYITNPNVKFEDIIFKLVIGYEDEGYSSYNALLSFISQNGLNNYLVLEYTFEMKGVLTTRYCDVIISSFPKSEKTKFRVLEEQIVLKRISHFYTQNIVAFGLGLNEQEEQIPFDFPIPFNYRAVTTSITLTNTFFEPIPLNVFIRTLESQSTTISPVINILINGVVVQTLKTYINLSYPMQLDSNSESKRVIYRNGTSETNGYSYLNMNNSIFLYLPIGTSTITTNATSSINYQVFIQYKEKILG